MNKRKTGVVKHRFWMKKIKYEKEKIYLLREVPAPDQGARKMKKKKVIFLFTFASIDFICEIAMWSL